MRNARGLGREDLRARRRAPQSAAVAVRSGPPRRARMGLRLPARRPVALGDGRHGALWRPDARGSVPRRAGLDPRWPGHRGAPARERRAVGLVNGMRIGPDVDASWPGVQPPARAAGLRSFSHRSTWLNDPDCLVVRPPLSSAAAEVWASVVAVTGGITLFGDNLPKLPPDRLTLLRRTLPVAPVKGRAIEMGVAERDTAPAIVAGDDVYPISGPWRFRTGDDPSY